MGDALHVEGFPEHLRRRMRALAAMQGITLREAMTQAAERWCAETVKKNIREHKIPVVVREEEEDGS